MGEWKARYEKFAVEVRCRRFGVGGLLWEDKRFAGRGSLWEVRCGRYAVRDSLWELMRSTSAATMTSTDLE